VTVVNADTKKNGDGRVDGRATEIENASVKMRLRMRTRVRMRIPADFGRFFGIGGNGAVFTTHEGGFSFKTIIFNTRQVNLKFYEWQRRMQLLNSPSTRSLLGGGMLAASRIAEQ
jgi:hypothetical protein